MFLMTLPWTLVAAAVPTVRSIPRNVWLVAQFAPLAPGPVPPMLLLRMEWPLPPWMEIAVVAVVRAAV